MSLRLASILPRFVALPLVALLGTAAVTFADVTRQAFVFAKGTLEDAGFAWKVVGPVGGYAANTVVTQAPAPGTRVVDTGAPTLQLSLVANSRYKQEGSPENSSPYAGTPIKIAGAAPQAP